MLQPIIRRRQAEHYLMWLRIVDHPHMEKNDRKKFANELIKQVRSADGPGDDKLDRAGLNRLRKALKNEKKSKIKVK